MSDKKYIGSAALAKRYDRTIRTVARWISDPPIGFPRPIKINRRHLWDLDDLERYERGIGKAPAEGRAA